jgi:hypothetical protein
MEMWVSSTSLTRDVSNRLLCHGRFHPAPLPSMVETLNDRNSSVVDTLLQVVRNGGRRVADASGLKRINLDTVMDRVIDRITGVDNRAVRRVRRSYMNSHRHLGMSTKR